MKREVKIGTALVFAVFYGFLLMQFAKVFIYYDDYGYLSLSYGNTVANVAGSSYTLPQLVEFMGKHYLYSNGRLLYLFLFSFLNMLGGLRLVQVSMATGVLAVLVLAYTAVLKQSRQEGFRPVALAGFICMLYGTIGIMIHRLGTYWYAASFLYVVPAAAFFCLAVLYFGTVEKQPGRGVKAACILLAFMGAFSQEEWLVAVIGFICMVIGYKLYKKVKVNGYDYGILTAAVAGALPILTSPAVKMRMDNNLEFSQLPFLEKITTNVRILVGLFFSRENINYIWLFLIMMAALGIYMAVRKMRFSAMNAIYGLFNIVLLAWLFLKLKRGLFGGPSYSDLQIAVLSLYLIITLIQVIRLLWEKDCVLLGMIFLSAVLTLACLVIVPEIPLRVILPFLFLSYSLLGYLFCLIFLDKKVLVLGGALLVLLCAVSIPNLSKIYRGYRINYNVLMDNDRVLRSASQKIQVGEEVEKVDLYRIPDGLCASEMVYDENFSYMVFWMEEYYDLPFDVELNYREITDITPFLK